MIKLLSRRSGRRPADPTKPTASTVTRPRHRVVRRFQVGLLVGLGVGLFLLIVILLGSLRPFESRLADLFYRPRAPSGQVALIVADDKTVEEYGWPLERFVHSGLLYAVMAARPKLIVMDYILPEPTNSGEDEFFAMVIQRAGKVVQPVIGIEATRYPASVSQFPAYDMVLMPSSPLRTSNTTLAHAMIYPDSDGVTRRVPLAMDVPGQRYLSIAITALALAQGVDLNQVTLQDHQVVFGNTRIPVDDNGQVILNFVNRDAITRISYADITQGKADYSLLRDKIVLIGPATVAVHESYAVPLPVGNAPMSNVEIQANLLETLISGSFLREQDRTTQIAEVLFVSALAGISLVQLPWLYAGALMLVYLVLYLLYAFQRFDSGVISTPLYVVLALGMTYALTILYRYLSEERGRSLVARAFLGIVSPETVNQVLAQYERGALSLSGGRREATVLCVGLRELTGLSEAMAPEMLIELLNRYTARILETVFRWDGSVNMVGNNIIAVWNLPLDHPDHAHRAVNAAFDVLHSIAQLQPTSSAERHVGVCLGIATGTAIAGQISVSARADYTVIGEVVTVAERVSILAGDNQVLVDPATYQQVHDEFETRDVHTIRVRGKKDPLLIRQVLQKVAVKT